MEKLTIANGGAVVNDSLEEEEIAIVEADANDEGKFTLILSI
jgi:hypothetical protein